MTRTPHLIPARRIADVLRLINKKDQIERNDEQEEYDHVAAGFYLVGAFAILEGRFSRPPQDRERPWNIRAKELVDLDKYEAEEFDRFVTETRTKPKWQQYRVDKAILGSMCEIRNAFTHNDCDLTRNWGKTDSLAVAQADTPVGVVINADDGIFRLGPAFIEHVRLAYIAISAWHGVT